MTALDDLLAMGAALDEVPLFYVEPPDGQKHLAEIDRQLAFRKQMAWLSPATAIWATPNAGKRGVKAQRDAKKEGLVAGVFDLANAWNCDIAWIEMKGYTAAGRPGTLSPAQITWGNRMFRLGHKVACFFRPESAIAWLVEQGCPIRTTQ